MVHKKEVELTASEIWPRFLSNKFKEISVITLILLGIWFVLFLLLPFIGETASVILIGEQDCTDYSLIGDKMFIDLQCGPTLIRALGGFLISIILVCVLGAIVTWLINNWNRAIDELKEERELEIERNKKGRYKNR